MRTTRALLGLLIASAGAVASIALASGCSLDWDLPAIGNSSEASPDGAALVDGGGAGTVDGAMVVVPKDASCTSNKECPNGLCYFPDTTKCTAGGICVPVDTSPPTCAAATPANGEAKVCTCEDNLVATVCDANKQGSSLAKGCKAPDAGYFTCGYALCNTALQFCETFGDGHYACMPFAMAGCTSQHTCACAKTSCNGACDGGPASGATGEITVRCP